MKRSTSSRLQRSGKKVAMDFSQTQSQVVEDEGEASSSSSDLVIVATVETAFDVRQLIITKNLKQNKLSQNKLYKSKF